MESGALLVFVLFAGLYIFGILLFDRQKDKYALILITLFCIAMGLRSPQKIIQNHITGQADPLAYAALLTNDTEYYQTYYSDQVEQIDFVLFNILHPFTGNILNFRGALILLDLLYLPALYLLYRMLSPFGGAFYIFVGCLMFTNDGVLLMSNFFREAMGALFLLVMIMYMLSDRGKKVLKYIEICCLPLLHLTVLPLAFQALFVKRKHFRLISTVIFTGFCATAVVLFRFVTRYASYESSLNLTSVTRDLSTELLVKVLLTYVVLSMAFLINRTRKSAVEPKEKDLKRALEGFALPSAALLMFMTSAPEIGSRFIYYIHPIAYMYLALAISCATKRALYGFMVLALCAFGAFSWSYPTVTILLQW